MRSLKKPSQRRAAARRRVYAFESGTVSAGADHTGTTPGITNLSREQERRAREKEAERRHLERLLAVAAEHRDARLDVYAGMMTAATTAAVSGNPVVVGLAGLGGFVGTAAARCSGTQCHLTRSK